MELHCDWCGTAFTKWPSKVTKHNFCSRACLAKFSSRKHNPGGFNKLKDTTKLGRHLPELNRALNPTRMTEETRNKISETRLSASSSTYYVKRHGRHEHRVVVEAHLGRPLRSDEIVHHIDGNKRNNDISNLAVMTQSEHIKLHLRQGDLRKKNNEI